MNKNIELKIKEVNGRPTIYSPLLSTIGKTNGKIISIIKDKPSEQNIYFAETENCGSSVYYLDYPDTRFIDYDHLQTTELEYKILYFSIIYSNLIIFDVETPVIIKKFLNIVRKTNVTLESINYVIVSDHNETISNMELIRSLKNSPKIYSKQNVDEIKKLIADISFKMLEEISHKGINETIEQIIDNYDFENKAKKYVDDAKEKLLNDKSFAGLALDKYIDELEKQVTLIKTSRTYHSHLQYFLKVCEIPIKSKFTDEIRTLLLSSHDFILVKTKYSILVEKLQHLNQDNAIDIQSFKADLENIESSKVYLENGIEYYKNKEFKKAQNQFSSMKFSNFQSLYYQGKIDQKLKVDDKGLSNFQKASEYGSYSAMFNAAILTKDPTKLFENKNVNDTAKYYLAKYYKKHNQTWNNYNPLSGIFNLNLIINKDAEVNLMLEEVANGSSEKKYKAKLLIPKLNKCNCCGEDVYVVTKELCGECFSPLGKKTQQTREREALELSFLALISHLQKDERKAESYMKKVNLRLAKLKPDSINLSTTHLNLYMYELWNNRIQAQYYNNAPERFKNQAGYGTWKVKSKSEINRIFIETLETNLIYTEYCKIIKELLN